MNNKKVKEIIKFSFYKNIQNKWFIIFNLITLISIVLIVNWGTIFSFFVPKEKTDIFKIAVLDKDNIVYDNFLEKFSGDKSFEVFRIDENSYSAENIPDDFAIVEILNDDEEVFKISFISKEGIESNIYKNIENKLLEVRNELFVSRYGVPKEQLDIFQRDLSVNRVMLSVNADNSTTKELIKLFSSAFTYMLTVFIFSKMANEIAGEKQSKSTEYILTTVSAKEYLFAKIFSNIAILLIQGLFVLSYYYIAVVIFNITKIANTDISLSAGILTQSISKDVVYYILALIVYNVLNLILLSIIQAVFSSKASSTSEAGNTVSLIIFIILAAYIATIYIITPYTKMSILIYIISCLPVLSAYFVPAMMVIGQATLWQIVISLFILVISIPIVFNVSAKIFKNGILDYTKVGKKKEKEHDKEKEQKIFIEKRKMKNIGFVVGLSIILYVGLQTIFTLIGELILPVLFNNLNSTELTLILQIILQVVSLGVASIFVLAYVEKKENNEVKTIKFANKMKIVFIALLLIFGLQYLLSLVIYPAIGLDYSSTDMFDINYKSSLLSKIILILSIAVTPAIFEELFFRKSIISFTKQYGKGFALVFSALFFGIMHMNLSQGLFAFLIGLIFGAIYLYTNDIKLTMFIHFINNGFAALEMILPEIGAVIIGGILVLSLITGLALFLILLSKKQNREKIKEICLNKVSINSRYKYLFTDFTFDVSLVLVLLMSILTENILR